MPEATPSSGRYLILRKPCDTVTPAAGRLRQAKFELPARWALQVKEAFVKNLLFVVCFILVLGSSTAVHAAGCAAEVLPAPAVSTEAPAQHTVTAPLELAALVVLGLAVPAEVEPIETTGESCLCAAYACKEDPDPDGGCGCPGFFCNGRFVCGWPAC